MLAFYQQTRVILQAIFLGLLLISIAHADSTVVPQQLMEQTSKEMVKAFMDQTETIRKDPQVAHRLIDENLVPKINFPLMSRWVLGKNWKIASPEQQQEFIVAFRELVIKFYSKALVQYLEKNNLTEDIITFIPFRGKIDSKYATVRSQVNPPNGAEPVKVNYDLYHSKSGQWQVYDVSVEGVSLVTTYRSSFNNIIKNKGMDALLAELKDKNSQLNKESPEAKIATQNG
jgi:phospholipid transport system substrate-binding protein